MRNIMRLMYLAADKSKFTPTVGQFFKNNQKPTIHKQPVLHTRPKQIKARRG